MARPLLPAELWERIEPLLPPPKPRRFRFPGRKPIDNCEPTAHRTVRKVMSPTAHRYAEGESGPTSVVPTGGGPPLARRPRRRLHVGRLPAVVGLVSGLRSTPGGSLEAPSRGEVPHEAERCGGGPERHNLSDALSVRDDVG